MRFLSDEGIIRFCKQSAVNLLVYGFFTFFTAGRLRIAWFYDEGKVMVCTHGFFKDSQETILYQVIADIKIDSTDENPSQDNVTLKAIGIFTVYDSFEDKENIVKATGASILYSASRDFLLTIMSRGPWVPIMLNLMAFKPLGKPDPTKVSEGSQAKPKRKK